MTNINNKHLNNISIIVFEILIAFITYFVIENYDGQTEKLFLIFILVIFILSNIYIGLYLEKRDKELLALQKNLASENHINNTIFNLQKAIIVVRDDISMTQANDTFFQTFDFKDIEDFTSKHICICELFISKKNHPHMMPMMEGISWAHYIIENPDKQHDAYMIDKYGNERIYSIDLRENVFASSSMVVFTEITEIKNQMETFHKLFDNSVDGLLILQNNSFLDVNHTLLNMVGCNSKEKFLNLTPKSLLPLRQPNNKFSIDLHEEMLTECFERGISSRQRIQKNSQVKSSGVK